MNRVLLLMLLSVHHMCFAQQLTYPMVLTYTHEHQDDSTNTGSKKSEDMLLLIKDNHSVFLSKKNYLADSFLAKPHSGIELKNFFATNSSRIHYRIFKESSIKYIDQVGNRNYQYEEKRDEFHWNILADTATINGWHCQKATTHYGGRIWEAWFDPSIAINDGPYTFHGLPGLIIKINDKRAQFSFILTAIEMKNIEIHTDGDAPARTTKKEFQQALNYYMNHRYEMMLAQGSSVKDEKAAAFIRGNLEKVQLTINNTIELPGKN